MKKIFLGVFVILLSLTSVSFAGEESEFAKKMMKELDIENKGYAIKKDMEVFSQKEFRAMDINSDGLVSADEFFEYVCEKSCQEGNCECKSYKNKKDIDYMKEYWNRVDKDASGTVTYQEKLESDMETFYGLDYDGDGKITKEEMEAQFY